MNASLPVARWAAKLRSRGLGWAARAAIERVKPSRVPIAESVREQLRGAVGLELGGPSEVFGTHGILPLYDVLQSLDLLDYAEHTLWTETRETDRADEALPIRRVIIGEAAQLLSVEDATYDVVLSAHVIEHLADPLGALAQWRRVLRPAGHLVIVIPDGTLTFDRRRPISGLDHLRDDRGADESDATHATEFVDLYDHTRAEYMLSRDELADRVARNVETRFMHHHVFDLSLGEHLLADAGFTVAWRGRAWPFHLVYIASIPTTADSESKS